MKIPPEVVDTIDDNRWSMGETRRIKHINCSEDKDAALSIKRVSDGWVYHCFRCPDCAGFISAEKQSPRDVQRRLEHLQHLPAYAVEERVQLPQDCVKLLEDSLHPNVPNEVYTWLWKFHMKLQTMHKYEFAWSSYYQRLIIPVYDSILLSGGDVGRKLIGWLGRDVVQLSKSERRALKRPKWFTRKNKGAKHFFYHLLGTTQEKVEQVVIVEDVISAIQVHEATGYHTLALNTTFLPTEMIVKLKPYQVYIWLDGNMLEKPVKYASTCSSLGVKVKVLHTLRDPKEYSHFNIVKLLHGGEV